MKFSIRDLLLVTVIVALAVGWWLDRGKLADKVDDLEHELEMEKSPYGRIQWTPRPNSPAPAPNPPKP